MGAITQLCLAPHSLSPQQRTLRFCRRSRAVRLLGDRDRTETGLEMVLVGLEMVLVGLEMVLVGLEMVLVGLEMF